MVVGDGDVDWPVAGGVVAGGGGSLSAAIEAITAATIVAGSGARVRDRHRRRRVSWPSPAVELRYRASFRHDADGATCHKHQVATSWSGTANDSSVANTSRIRSTSRGPASRVKLAPGHPRRRSGRALPIDSVQYRALPRRRQAGLRERREHRRLARREVIPSATGDVDTPRVDDHERHRIRCRGRLVGDGEGAAGDLPVERAVGKVDDALGDDLGVARDERWVDRGGRSAADERRRQRSR